MYALDNTDYVPGWGYEFHDPSYGYPPDRVLRAGDKMADLSFFKTGLLWNYLSSETVYRCPSYTSRKYKKGVVFWGPTDGKIPVWSYAENGQAAMSCQSKAAQASSRSNFEIKLANLRTAPTQTALLLEAC